MKPSKLLDTQSDKRKQLTEKLMQAKFERDHAQIQDFETQLEKLDDIIWNAKSELFPDLARYSSLFEALKINAIKLGVKFPDLEYSHKYRFIFVLVDESRSIGIYPIDDERKHKIGLTETVQGQKYKYKGETKSLTDASLILSLWYMERHSIELIRNKFPWISTYL